MSSFHRKTKIVPETNLNNPFAMGHRRQILFVFQSLRTLYLTNTICIPKFRNSVIDKYYLYFKELYFEQQMGRGRQTCENPNLEKEM